MQIVEMETERHASANWASVKHEIHHGVEQPPGLGIIPEARVINPGQAEILHCAVIDVPDDGDDGDYDQEPHAAGQSDEDQRRDNRETDRPLAKDGLVDVASEDHGEQMCGCQNTCEEAENTVFIVEPGVGIPKRRIRQRPEAKHTPKRREIEQHRIPDGAEDAFFLVEQRRQPA